MKRLYLQGPSPTSWVVSHLVVPDWGRRAVASGGHYLLQKGVRLLTSLSQATPRGLGCLRNSSRSSGASGHTRQGCEAIFRSLFSTSLSSSVS